MHLKHFPLLVVITSAALASLPAQAQVYAETTDAGETLSTAATPISATGTLTMITGTLSSSNDADLFEIDLTGTTAFSATTNNVLTNNSTTGYGPNSGLDTALFLFDSAGNALETNDDANGTTFTSTLPASNPLKLTLNAGVYYLGISGSGNEPINSAGQLLFNMYPGGDTTAVRGAAVGLNPYTLSTFDSNAYDSNNFGAYEIDLTGVDAHGGEIKAGATVPEPSTWSALLLGAAALVFLQRRLRRA